MFIETIKETFEMARALDFTQWGSLYLLTLLMMQLIDWVRGSLNAMRIKRLERQASTVANRSGWIIPTTSCFENPSFRTRQKLERGETLYTEQMLYSIRPFTSKEICELTLYNQRSAAVQQIVYQRRILTVSAVVYGFPVPEALLLIDEGSIQLYQEYRNATRPVYADLEEMRLSWEHAQYPVPAQRVQYLYTEIAPQLTVAIMEFAGRDTWPMLELFVLPMITVQNRLLHPDARAILTAYAAYTHLSLPADYIDNSALAFQLYQHFAKPTGVLTEPALAEACS